MKNIHILPTDKPSRLSKQLDNPLVLYKQFIENRKFGKWSINQNIYITSDEEIKEGDYCISHLNIIDKGKIHNSQTIFNPKTKEHLILLQSCKKIILTTDQDLIKDGVQAIDDEFLEWFFNNSSCEEVEVKKDKIFTNYHNQLDLLGSVHIIYKIIIPKEEPKQEYICYKCKNKTNNKFEICDKCNVGWKEPKQETLEEVAEKLYPTDCSNWSIKIPLNERKAFIKGIKWQQERSYSEEEVINIVEKSRETGLTAEYLLLTEQFKKK